jgi:hypothetical protein
MIAKIKKPKQDSPKAKGLNRIAKIKRPKQDSQNQKAILFRPFDFGYPV